MPPTEARRQPRTASASCRRHVCRRFDASRPYTALVPTDAERQAYRDAFDDWQRKLQDVHAFLLDGDRQGRRPDEIKGMLNREARAKAAYDAARLRLLGIDE